MTRQMTTMLSRTAAAVAVTMALAVPAQAALIGLVQRTPDISADTLDLRYDSTNDVLTLKNTAGTSSVDVDPAQGLFPYFAQYDLRVTFDGTKTGTFSSGSLKIESGPTNILVGDLSAFGFLLTGAGASFDFLATASASVHPAFTGLFGGKFVVANLNAPDFTADFRMGSVSADHFPVPEPATLSLLLLGSGLLAARKRFAPRR